MPSCCCRGATGRLRRPSSVRSPCPTARACVVSASCATTACSTAARRRSSIPTRREGKQGARDGARGAGRGALLSPGALLLGDRLVVVGRIELGAIAAPGGVFDRPVDLAQ